MSSAKKLQYDLAFTGADLVLPGLIGDELVVSNLAGREVLELNGMRTAIFDGDSRSEVLQFCLKHNVSQIVQSSGASFQMELNSALNIMGGKSCFMDFPLASIFFEGRVDGETESSLSLMEQKFSKGSEKYLLQTEAEKQMSTVIKSSSLVTEILGVSDELITNVLYNAPYVDRENSSSGIQRDSKGVQLAKGLMGNFVVGSDGDRLVVGCEDPYGTLNLNNMVARVLNCYNTGIADNMNMGKGGARIGMFMMINSCTSFYAGVKEGKVTKVYCVFPVKMGNKKRAEEPLNIHIYRI